MAKEVKSLDELRDMVEALVRKNPEYAEVRPLSAYWHERDKDGCNWNVSHWRGPDVLVSAAANAIGADAQKLRLTYDAPTP